MPETTQSVLKYHRFRSGTSVRRPATFEEADCDHLHSPIHPTIMVRKRIHQLKRPVRVLFPRIPIASPDALAESPLRLVQMDSLQPLPPSHASSGSRHVLPTEVDGEIVDSRLPQSARARRHMDPHVRPTIACRCRDGSSISRQVRW